MRSSRTSRRTSGVNAQTTERAWGLPFGLILVTLALPTVGQAAPRDPAAPQHVPQLAWDALPDLPDALGVAGPLVGVHRDALIVAGGANFPRPVWDNEKAWHDRIHVLTRAGDHYQWFDGGKLPRKVAYAATVSTPHGVVCMGGNDASTTFADVLVLQWDPATRQVLTTRFPPLPQPCAYGAAALVGDTIYLAGGQSDLGLDSAMRNFWSLDLSQRDNATTFIWRQRDPWPGASRAFNLTVHHRRDGQDRLYVISGRRQEGESPQFLKDVWEFTPHTGRWQPRQDAPRCVMAGTAIDFDARRIVVLGGADGSLFFQGNELQDRHPGFVKEGLFYDVVADRWDSAGPLPRNHVTTQAVRWDGGLVIASGEVRPRVRSAKVWRFRPRGEQP